MNKQFILYNICTIKTFQIGLNFSLKCLRKYKNMPKVGRLLNNLLMMSFRINVNKCRRYINNFSSKLQRKKTEDAEICQLMLLVSFFRF